MNIWPFRRHSDGRKNQNPPLVKELRIATSGSYSIKASIEALRVDGAGSYSQGGRVRAALFSPMGLTTVQFHADGHKKPGVSARASCVHVVQLFTHSEAASILDDAKRIGAAIGWSDRGVSLPTQDVLVQNLSKESQDCVHRAIREHLLPFARRHYPELNAAFDKQPYPRPGNLFIVRYSGSSQRPGGRGLKMHKDETALTFNLCLSPIDGFVGGGTYFPASASDVDGILLRPNPGQCLVHDGNIKHAGNEVLTGERYILVGFYNADGRDRAGEEQYFNKRALEEARNRERKNAPPPTQTIYFTTAVATSRGNTSGTASPAAADPSVPPVRPVGATGEEVPPSDRRGVSSVAIQGPVPGETTPPASASSTTSARNPQGGTSDRGGSSHRMGTGAGSSSDRINGGASTGGSTSPTSQERNVRDQRDAVQADAPSGGRRSPRPVQTGHVLPASNLAPAANASQREWHPPKCIPNWLVLQMLHNKLRSPHLGKGSQSSH